MCPVMLLHAGPVLIASLPLAGVSLPEAGHEGLARVTSAGIGGCEVATGSL
jgi:hypothetical protein